MIATEQAGVLLQMTEINQQQKAEMTELLCQPLAVIRRGETSADEPGSGQEVERTRKNCDSRIKNKESISMPKQDDVDGNKCLWQLSHMAPLFITSKTDLTLWLKKTKQLMEGSHLP